MLCGLLFAGISAKAQFSRKTPIHQPDSAMYPETYTFEQAAAFEKAEAWDKAIWFYINLFEQDPSKVIKKMKKVVNRLDQPAADIREAFAFYSVYDPDVSRPHLGHRHYDWVAMKVKNSWLDAIILRVAPDNIKSAAKSIN